MKTYLLHIPTKKTDEVNWVKPLSNYLISVYGSTSDYIEDINAFNKLRQDIRGANADLTSIKLYYKYYSQVELLDLRIPFATVNKHKKINFEWFDAFSPSIVHKQAALPFEKANILFNLGALLSRLATVKYQESQKKAVGSDDETTKEALQYFQQASGIFQFLNENFLHAPSADLSQSTVKFLVKLMLAQAQEVFVLKVVTGDLEQKKNSLISKLCRSASAHYEECHNMISIVPTYSSGLNEYTVIDSSEIDDNFLENPEDSEAVATDSVEENNLHVTARLDPSWTATINFKHIYYKSLAYYFNALHLESNRKFGEALAYLTKSQEILNEINSYWLKQIAKSSSSDSYEILDNYKYQKDAIAIKLADLTKDNDLIYHDIIPSLLTLPDIKPMDSTKIIPINQNILFQEVNEYNYGNFLTNVVPINIHELSSFYSEEKSQFLRNELDAVDVSNEETTSVLEYLKLPKALVTIKELINSSSNIEGNNEGSQIDATLLGIAGEINQESNNDAFNKEKIIDLRKKIYEAISESESILGQQFSDALVKFKDEILNLKKTLYDATNSDNQLFALINSDNAGLYSILQKGPNSNEFKQLFKTKDSNSNKSGTATELSLLDMDESQLVDPKDIINKDIKTVEDLLHDINVIKSNKSKLIETLKKEIHNDDISDILILNSKIKSSNEIKSVIFPEELKKFQPYNEELDKLIESERKFINNLKQNWESLSTNPRIKNIQNLKSYQDILIRDQSAKITKFYNESWKRYSTGLKKGSKVYNDLLNYAVSLKQQIHSEVNRLSSRPPPSGQSIPSRQSSLTEGFNNLTLGPQYSGHSTGYGYQSPQPPQQPSQQPPVRVPSGLSGQGSYNQTYGTPSPSASSSTPNYFDRTTPQHQPFPQPQLYNTPTVNDGYNQGLQYYQQHQQPPPQQQPYSGGLSNHNTGNYARPPPQLPPKTPSAGALPSSGSSYTGFVPQQPPTVPSSYQQQQHQQQQQQQPQPQPQPQPQSQYNQPGQPVLPSNANNNSNSNLIYDQPSTYQPNMYNFFSNNNN
ncbi:BRO1-like domain-containing protein [Scheffersomyces amazonensis]|uniref:BRO1-like domain-containing protein n=1 Tax=Scheffersomyces amazonensis TaxID=1078765 RepID=UPI00315D498E